MYAPSEKQMKVYKNICLFLHDVIPEEEKEQAVLNSATMWQFMNKYMEQYLAERSRIHNIYAARRKEYWRYTNRNKHKDKGEWGSMESQVFMDSMWEGY